MHSTDNLWCVRHVRIVKAGKLGRGCVARGLGIEHDTSGDRLFSILGTDCSRRGEARGCGGLDEIGVQSSDCTWFGVVFLMSCVLNVFLLSVWYMPVVVLVSCLVPGSVTLVHNFKDSMSHMLAW